MKIYRVQVILESCSKLIDKYYPYIKDHLGNNRVVADKEGGVLQSTEFYPFGLSYGDDLKGGDNQPYKYNGKELDTNNSLNMYDYSARYFDPAVPRFTSVDPLAEKYYSISPYAYVANNPLRFIDPTGMAYGDFDEETMPDQRGTLAAISNAIMSWAGFGSTNKSSTSQSINKQLDKLNAGQQRIENSTLTAVGRAVSDVKEDPSILISHGDASGLSIDMDITAGGSFGVSPVQVIKINSGADKGKVFRYQSTAIGAGGTASSSVSLNYQVISYTGDRSNFDKYTLQGEGVQISFSYGSFNASILVGDPDSKGGRVISGSIGSSASQSATKAGFNKRKVETKLIE